VLDSSFLDISILVFLVPLSSPNTSQVNPPQETTHDQLSMMDHIPTTNETKGEPESITNKILETGAAATQNFAPPKRVCAHLNAFHAYANDPTRCVETNHYCAHLNDGISALPAISTPH